MSNKNQYRMTVQMGDDEERMVEILKNKHSINMSQLVKNCIKDTYKKLETINE